MESHRKSKKGVLENVHLKNGVIVEKNRGGDLENFDQNIRDSIFNLENEFIIKKIHQNMRVLENHDQK